MLTALVKKKADEKWNNIKPSNILEDFYYSDYGQELNEVSNLKFIKKNKDNYFAFKEFLYNLDLDFGEIASGAHYWK